MALLDFRKKSLATQADQQQAEQSVLQQQTEPLEGSSNGHAAQLCGERGLSEDGPETPPKMHSSGSPPPEGVPLQSAQAEMGGAIAPPGAAASPEAALGAALGPDVPARAAGSSAGQAIAAPHPATPAEPGSSAAGSGQAGPASSAFSAAAQSLDALSDGSADSLQHVPPMRPRISKAKRYDMLLGD